MIVGAAASIVAGLPQLGFPRLFAITSDILGNLQTEACRPSLTDFVAKYIPEPALTQVGGVVAELSQVGQVPCMGRLRGGTGAWLSLTEETQNGWLGRLGALVMPCRIEVGRKGWGGMSCTLVRLRNILCACNFLQAAASHLQ